MTEQPRLPRLESASAAVAYQREWFHGLRARTEAGEPLVLANADAPHEVLRAMDIPYVVNQWWSSIIAAKRAAPASLAAIAAAGLPDDSRQYDVLPLGAQDLASEDAPWGGLPEPRFAISERSGDVTHKIFERWARRSGTETFLLSRTAAVPAPEGWWESVAHDWDDVFGSDRIDLLQGRSKNSSAGWKNVPIEFSTSIYSLRSWRLRTSRRSGIGAPVICSQRPDHCPSR